MTSQKEKKSKSALAGLALQPEQEETYTYRGKTSKRILNEVARMTQWAKTQTLSLTREEVKEVKQERKASRLLICR